MSEHEQPIIKRIVKKSGGHHGGAWKVAYADFVTAMMALFIVLWILSQSPETRNAIAAYFTDPRGVPVIQTGTLVLNNTGSGVFQGTPMATGRGNGMGSGDHYAKSLFQVDPELAKAASKLLHRIRNNPKLKRLSKMVRITVNDQGVRIEISDQLAGAFFDVGSARPTPELVALLREIGDVLKEIDNTLVIEGHTDSRPYRQGAKYSNWELSADRANAVRRLLMEMGIPAGRIAEVRAYADRLPLANTAPTDPRNRRVSILLKAKRPPLEHHRVVSRAKSTTEYTPRIPEPVDHEGGSHH